MMIGYLYWEVGRWNLNVYIVNYTHLQPEEGQSLQEYKLQTAFPIIESILSAMRKDFRAKFNWQDVHVFAEWYEQTTQEYRDLANRMVADKRFYFINGGWALQEDSMLDYRNYINQMTVGQEFLHKTFSIIPKIGGGIEVSKSSDSSNSLNLMLGIDKIMNYRTLTHPIGNDVKVQYPYNFKAQEDYR
jgi:hypothetical protein